MSAEIQFYLVAVLVVIILGLSKGGFSGLGMPATPIFSLVVSLVRAGPQDNQGQNERLALVPHLRGRRRLRPPAIDRFDRRKQGCDILKALTSTPASLLHALAA
jgi:hypothetical protein